MTEEGQKGNYKRGANVKKGIGKRGKRAVGRGAKGQWEEGQKGNGKVRAVGKGQWEKRGKRAMTKEGQKGNDKRGAKGQWEKRGKGQWEMRGKRAVGKGKRGAKGQWEKRGKNAMSNEGQKGSGKRGAKRGERALDDSNSSSHKAEVNLPYLLLSSAVLSAQVVPMLSLVLVCSLISIQMCWLSGLFIQSAMWQFAWHASSHFIVLSLVCLL